MGTDVIAIIGPQSSGVAHIVSHVADEFQVPLLSFAATDPTLSAREFPYFIRTTHSDLYQMNAVAQIVDHYGWREVIVIFEDNNYGRNGISALDDKLADRRCRISNKLAIPQGHGTNQSHITDLLVQVALLDTRVVVLHVNHDSGFMIFDEAKYLNMMGNGFVWIATDWLSSVLDSAFPLPSKTMDTLHGVLALRLHTPDSDRKAFFSKWNKLTGGSLGLHSYGLHAYDSVWLVAHAIDAFFNQGGIVSFSNDSKITATEQSGSLYLDSMNIFDDGPLLLKTILQSNLVGLSGPIKFDSERALALPAYDIINVVGTGFRRIGYWSNYSGLSTVTPEKLYSMPPNRSSENQQLHSVIWPGDALSKPRGWVFTNNGKKLRIGVPIRVSYREFVSQVQGTDSFKGFCIDVFNAAINLMPYAVTYKFIPFGDGHKNPSYTELVNSITTGVFDAAIGDISIVTDRTKIVDFSQPYAGSGLVVVVPFKKLSFGVWAFLRPFTARMWIVTAAFSLVIGVVMWILEHRVNDKFRGPPKRQLINILWFSLATLFLADRQNPVSTVGRAVLPIWLFVVTIIHSSYTASLTSFLTVQQLSSPINGIESLRNSDQPIGYPVGSFAEHYLTKDLGISKSRLIPLDSPLAYAQALELGPEKGGVAAVVDERPYVELFVSTHCKFRVVGQEFSKNGWGFAFPHDSPLAVDMSTAILQLSENGDLERIHDKWLKRSTCSSESSDIKIESDQLQLKSFVVLFLICGIACIIGLLVHFLQIVEKFRHAEPPQCATTSPGDPQSGRLRRFLSLIDKKADQSNSGSERRKVARSLSGNDKDGKKKQTELTEKVGPPESDYGLPNQEDLENYAFDEPSFRTKQDREDSYLEASTSNPSPKP